MQKISIGIFVIGFIFICNFAIAQNRTDLSAVTTSATRQCHRG